MADKKAANGLEKVLEIDVECILPNPQQPRQAFAAAELQALADSIRQYGLLQPVIVQKSGPGQYELVAGERRLRAAKLCGLKTIPAIVREYAAADSALLSLIENVQRADLDAIEEARAYARLSQEFGLTQAGVAQKVGKSRPYVANLIRLLQLPEEIQNWLSDGRLSIGQARPLLQLPGKKQQLQAAQQILQAGLSARQAEALVRRLLKEQPKARTQPDVYLESLQDKLKVSLGTPVAIHFGKNRQKGKIEISFTSEAEFERLLARLTEEDERQEDFPASSFHL